MHLNHIGEQVMTADDFLLLSIAFGGFLIFAVVLWGGARALLIENRMRGAARMSRPTSIRRALPTVMGGGRLRGRSRQTMFCIA